MKGLVTEGAGGLMVPLNAREHFGQHRRRSAQFRHGARVGLKLGLRQSRAAHS